MNGNQETECEKKVQLEGNMYNFEDTLFRIICGQTLTENGNEEELTVQLGFFSALRCHDPCAMELINHDVAKIRSNSVVQ
jgi:hypothetical protein